MPASPIWSRCNFNRGRAEEAAGYLAQIRLVQQMREHRGRDTEAALVALWRDEITPHVKQGVWTVLGSAIHSADYTVRLRRELTKLVGPEDANLLIANLSDEAGLLASLGRWWDWHRWPAAKCHGNRSGPIRSPGTARVRNIGSPSG